MDKQTDFFNLLANDQRFGNIPVKHLIDISIVMAEQLKKMELYEEALKYYAESSRGSIHEDGGNIARRVLKQ